MASNLQQALDLTEATNLYKTKFGKRSENAYNSANVLLGRVRKSFSFTGKKMEFPIPLSFQGGVGAGTLPEANVAEYEDINFTASKVYAVTRYDREAIKAAMSDEGAFFRATAENVDKTVEAFNRWMSIILHGDGDGALGVIASGGVVDNGSGNYTLTIDGDTSMFNFSKRDFVNIETGNTDLFEVESIDVSARTVTVQRSSGGSQVPAAADEIFMQGSEDAVPQGIGGVTTASSGTKYGVSIADPFISSSIAAGGSGVTPDLLNQIMLEVEEASGQTPNLLLCSYTQYRKILNQLEDQKRYPIEPRAQNLKGKIQFSGVEFMSTQGSVPIVPDRFCPRDRVYALNDNHIEIYHRPGFGWFDDDGTVFLRVADDDKYEARYGGYMECFINPPFQGVIDGLST